MDAQQYHERWQLAKSLLQTLSDNHHSSDVAEEICGILHEMQIYHAELEAQNSALRKRQQILAGERRHITYALYDAVNQSLFSARIISEALRESYGVSPDGELKNLNYLNASIERAIAEMRVLSLELRPERLFDTPLEILLRQLMYIFDEVHVTIDCDLRVFLADDVKIAIYRVAQEAITNIHQHANADEIRIQLYQVGNTIRFDVHDNGVGFDTNAIRHDSGLDNMRGSVESSGGKLDITSELNSGTQITAVW